MMISTHENGFIQLKVSESPCIRIHVWPDGPVVRQRTVSEVHDHRFSFISTVLRGELDHVIYRFEEDSHGPKEVLHVRNGILHPTGVRGHLKQLSVQRILPGECYQFDWGNLHESIPYGLTATLFQKVYHKTYNGKDPELRLAGKSDYQVRVIGNAGEVPDNSFSRDSNDPEVLWEFVRRALDGG